MIGRLLEDGVFLARFAYFYRKAPEQMPRVGFHSQSEPIPRKQRMAFAYQRAIGLRGPQVR